MPYWEAAKQHKLMMQKCAECGHIAFPPGHFCRRCRSAQFNWVEVSGRGTVYTFAVMRDTLISGLEPPYVVAQIELDDQPGLRMIANVLDCPAEAVHIGMPVQVTFQDVTDDITLPQFKPAHLGATEPRP